MKYVKRYLETAVEADLSRKMVFVGGPRQTGKTTFAMKLLRERGEDDSRYLNWDSGQDREMIIKETFPAGPGLLILDEIHKYSNWRQVLKGLFDKRGDELTILVTGSARLDYYRRGGDSLQGRYHFHRLLPFTFREVRDVTSDPLMRLFTFGGFPEPFSLASEKETRRWSREYRTRLIRDDLRDLENVSDISKLEHIVIRLPDLVGSPLSLNALREDIQVSHQTVSRWVTILENLYMIFRLYPFGAPKIRAVKKEAKHYHYDWTLIDEPGIRFENLMAVHLLKWIYYQQDTEGRDLELRYFRDVDRREVDFVIMENGAPVRFIESKLRYKSVSRSLKYLKARFPEVDAVQVVMNDDVDVVTKDGIRVVVASKYLDTIV
jgi:predicted AAA+ superfamily ATPase